MRRVLEQREPAHARALRFTTFRGFLPFPCPRTARDVREMWERRLADAAPAHPLWMHVHVPYCPQICTFCHCGKQLLTRDDQLDEWLDRTEAEVDFYAPALKGTRVRQQYFGGGTPNLLAPAQLDRLLDLLESRFEYDPTARRTLEMLPSAHRPGTLEVAARHGINRLSCGVQSTESELLRRVSRAPDFEPLARLMEEARARGIDDINVDLAWGLRGDSEELFFHSLGEVLALAPTTVSVHLLSPTAKNPVFSSEAEEREIYRRFYALADGAHARALDVARPGYEWRKLPTVVTLARTDYVAAGHYRSWQYSDMETVGIDMFGLGRFSLSHVLGWSRYENMTAIGRFDPDEAGYQIALTDGTVDGAMDALAELLRDGVCDLGPIAAYHGHDAIAPVRETLDRLVEAGHATREADVYRCRTGESIWFGPVGDLYELASTAARRLSPSAPAATPEPRAPEPEGATLTVGRVPITIEAARPDRRYFEVVGDLGVSHGPAEGIPSIVIGQVVKKVTRALARITQSGPRTPEEASRELERLFAEPGGTG